MLQSVNWLCLQALNVVHQIPWTFCRGHVSHMRINRLAKVYTQVRETRPSRHNSSRVS
ncbi:hypothetical protein BDP27DRAFT_1336967 [Rhodocollybia butyracea]|uniref:Uncharacterized protein n=1 Tax=Rhodocollybia butyracea TaxID=206335 RepID=A0A9P5PHI8_9AGAR|nr:hypothetical protein BDP27DRAFT_1336967 [Rhodocollybia butyracea]